MLISSNSNSGNDNDYENIIDPGIIWSFAACNGQQNPVWDKWNWLIGEWDGTGSGQPGQGDGIFTFKPEPDKKIIVRKGHSTYKGSANKSEAVHDDLMIIYPDYTGNVSKAIYFDNEGHTINYSITYVEKSIIFLSSRTQNTPLFRLSYTLLENDLVNTKFEMSQDSEKFTTYTEGKSRRTK